MKQLKCSTFFSGLISRVPNYWLSTADHRGSAKYFLPEQLLLSVLKRKKKL